jgi:hypothetical protein
MVMQFVEVSIQNNYPRKYTAFYSMHPSQSENAALLSKINMYYPL